MDVFLSLILSLTSLSLQVDAHLRGLPTAKLLRPTQDSWFSGFIGSQSIATTHVDQTLNLISSNSLQFKKTLSEGVIKCNSHHPSTFKQSLWMVVLWAGRISKKQSVLQHTEEASDWRHFCHMKVSWHASRRDNNPTETHPGGHHQFFCNHYLICFCQ